MEYKVLSLKWRPEDFDQIVGQNHITQALSNAIELNRLAHAFTFSGPRGVGKTSTARILAKKLNQIKELSESTDIIEMDAASNRGIDEIRNLKENINYAPAHGKYKIYIIDEVHMLTKEAFNALLKTLEEPPPYVIFIIATTELHKMPETIISRTQRYEFKRLTSNDIVQQMNKILIEEKINCDEKSLEMIARKADGSMRDALSILDQIICYCNNDITFDKVQSALGIVTDSEYYKLLSLIGCKKTGLILESLNKILENGVPINSFIEGFNHFIRNCILIKNSSFQENSKLESVSIKDVSHDELDLLRILDLCLKFQMNIKNFRQPQIVLETLMIKLSYIDRTINISKFLSNNKDLKKNEIEDIADDLPSANNSIEIEDTTNNNLKINSTSNEKNLNSKNNDNSKDFDFEEKKIISSKENSKVQTDNVDLEKTNNAMINLSDIEKKWPNIIQIINESNSKTANFLENVSFEKIEKNKLFVLIKGVNDFSIKSLEKDKNVIENTINKVLSVDFSLILIFDREPDIEKTKKKINKINQTDKDHPLFMDVLEKLDGKIIN